MALDFIAGCLGGCAGIAIGHPLDTVKVCLQTQDSQNPRYKNTFHCLQTIFAKEGIRGIYRGVTSPLLGVAGINAIVFGVYGNTQRWMNDSDSLRSHALAGGAAGFIQSFLCSPMELVKSRMQTGDTSKNPVECLKRIYRSNGTRGVFKGLGLTILREIPAFSTYFLTYELLTRRNDDLPVSTFAMLMGGGFAGVVSWAIVYPVDLLKSRYQIDGITSTKYTSSYDCLVKSVKGEGVSCLFRGLAPTLLRAFPVNAVTFTVVTWTMKLCSSMSINVTERVKDTEMMFEKCADAVLLSTAEYAAYAAL